MYMVRDQELVIRFLPEQALEALNGKMLEMERNCGGKRLVGARITKIVVSYEVSTEADNPGAYPPVREEDPADEPSDLFGEIDNNDGVEYDRPAFNEDDIIDSDAFNGA